MGRLIDADEMIDKYGEWYTEEGTEEGFIGTLEGVVYMMPTVEAIPVDWLLRKAEWCDKNNGIFVSGAIRSAVDAWREEQNNGTDKT